ncbi:MAG: nucleotidyl transferase AbiEii/AbiGii toxin family protein, partial [Candidatus Micrarchaeota archaeon]
MKEYDRDIVSEYAQKAGMNLGNAEKDYVLSAAIASISKLSASSELVFKGGTCLKKAYFPDYRFSSDLDFTGLNCDKNVLKSEITGIFQNKEVEGVNFSRIADLSKEDKKNLNLSIKYQSAISLAKLHVDSISIDVNFETKVLLEPKIRELLFPEEYHLPSVKFKVMQLEEILAEKIHAIYKRPKPRDLYDLHYL